MSENLPQTIKIDTIIIDEEINTRRIDRNLVLEYQDSIKEYGENWQDYWKELPRISESRHLWSGFHTVAASLGEFGADTTIRVVVEGETYRDAFFLATRSNHMHGRRRTTAEKENAVLRWLNDEDMNQWTDGYIAKMCQVDQKTVGNFRTHYGVVLSQPTKRKFISRNNQIEWMDTARIGTNQAPSPPPDPQAQIDTDYKAFVEHRDAAYESWKLFCELEEIPFDWDEFCLYAEEHLNGRGCVSAINPDEASLEEIRERSLTWQKMKSAISHGAKWVVSHRTCLKQKETDSKPDLEGLRENLKRFQGSDTEPNPSILSKAYHVPEEDVRKEIEKEDRRQVCHEARLAYYKAEEAFEASPLIKIMTFRDLKERSEGILGEGEILIDPQFTINMDNAQIRHLKDNWEKIAKDLTIPAQWVNDLRDAKATPLVEVLSDEEAKAAADASGATDMMLSGYIDDCKTSIEDLLATDQVPLILKYPAEEFLATLEKWISIQEAKSDG